MLESHTLSRRQFTVRVISAAAGSILGAKLLGQSGTTPVATMFKAADPAQFSRAGCFGIHYDLQPDSADPLWDKDVTADMLRDAWTKIRPDWIQCDCKGSAGLATYPTKVGYPKPGLQNDPLRIHRQVTRELNLPLMVHFVGIWDLAASSHHRDWTRRDASGMADNGKMCVRSPYLRELLIPQMLEVAVQYEVDGFWVDGDAWAMVPCYCRRCREAFEAQAGISDPPLVTTDPNWQAWLAFHRQSYLDYAKAYVDAVHAKRPDCIMCINWLYSIADPDQISIGVDLLSGDAVGDDQITLETRFWDSRGKPWNCMTWGFIAPPHENTGGLNKSAATGQFRALSEICQGAAEALSTGGGAIVFARPTMAGRLVSWEHDELAKVAEFCRARREISQDAKGVAQAVVLNSRAHAYAKATKMWNWSGLEEELGALAGAVHALLDAGYGVDIQNEAGLLARLGEYGLVVIGESNPIPDNIQRALEKYVEGGGRVVMSGAFVADDPGLAQFAGVAPAGAPLQGYYFIRGGHQAAQIEGPWQPVKVTEAKEWTPLLSTPETNIDLVGCPAITVRKLGNAGRVALIPGRVFAAYSRDRSPPLGAALRDLFLELWPDPLVRVEAVDDGLASITVRRKGSRLVVHLLNRTITTQRERDVRRHVEHLPPISRMVVRVKTAKRPSAVTLIPADSTKSQWDWSNGELVVSIYGLQIHSALAIDV